MNGIDSYAFPHTPTDIRVKRAEKILEISFDDGQSFSFAAEFLRVHSPSAEVQGHSPNERIVVAGRQHVGILSVEPVGQYAIRINFDDLHDTGIYSWRMLYDFGLRQESMWSRYLQEIEELGLNRKP